MFWEKPRWLLPLSAIYLILAPSVIGKCNFPSFVQTPTTKDEWKGRLEQQAETSKLRMTANEDIINLNSPRPNGKGYNTTSWKCLKEEGHDKYLVSVLESEHSLHERFRCVQILRRSKAVIQLRMSALSETRRSSLCDEAGLKLDEWPLVKADVFSNRDYHEPCPLQGGFQMFLFDQPSRTSVCSVYDGQTRLESECAVDDGMYFRFRFTRCVPGELNMFSTQRTYCVARWHENKHTFTVLKADFNPYMWIFRFPTHYSEFFVAYLMYNVRADTHALLGDNTDFVQLQVKPDKSFNLSSLCYNDYQICTEMADPCFNKLQKFVCAKACDMCSSNAPVQSVLPGDVQGVWIDPTKTVQLPIWINDTSLEIPGIERMHSVDFPWRANLTAENSDKLLVTVFNNGCRPRYTCMRAVRRSPSFLHIKLGTSMMWPSAPEQMVCKDTAYGNPHSTQPLTLRKRYFTPLVLSHSQSAVDCKLGGISQVFDASVGDVNCSVSLNQTVDKERFITYGENCSQTIHNKTFTCLATWLDSPAHHMVVTVVQSGTDEYFCWIFRRKKRRMLDITLVSFEECHEGVRKRLSQGHVIPLGVFKPLFSAIPTTTTDPWWLQTTTQPVDISHRPNYTVIDRYEHPFIAYIHKFLMVLYLIILSLCR